MEHKVLIITYYWPPSGGSGVQRWLKFVKYLPQLGWTPYVFTPENPSFSMKDESLLRDVPPEAEVIHFPIWEPYGVLQWMRNPFGTRQPLKESDYIVTGKKSLFQHIMAWVRGNLLIPDPRVFWVKPSVAFLEDFIRDNKIRAIITTGPPHSMHLIGLKLRKKFPALRWLADFRDPWTEWDIYDNLHLTSIARAYHRKLEREVLRQADVVLSISPFHVERLRKLGGKNVQLLTNGYDPDDFRGIEYRRTDHFTIRHLGVVDDLRDPRPFMKALRQLLTDHPEYRQNVRVEFIGNVNTAFVQWVHQDEWLASVTSFKPYMKHAEVLQVYGETDVLLLVLANTAIAPGNLPGKMFEYLAAGRPILAIGPPAGDAAEIIQATGAGQVADKEDIDGLRAGIVLYYEKWKNGHQEDTKSKDVYSRKALAARLIDLMSN